MAGLIGEAALGAAFGELLKVVEEVAQQTASFKTQLTILNNTLKSVEPVFNEIVELNKEVLNRPDETVELTRYLEDGKDLVAKCSNIKWWNLLKKRKYGKELICLDKKLVRFFKIKAPANCTRTNLMTLGVTKEVNQKVDQILSTATSEFLGSCSVPGLPEFVVGLDQRLAELKQMLLKDDTRLLVVSAPGGFGKTTLSLMLCHDAEIKGEFGDNIFYFTISQKASILNIAMKLSKCNDINYFTSEEDAKNQIESLIKQTGSGKKLLVLDDVWPTSASIIRDLMFNIPGLKILVTSRSEIPNSTLYDLTFLNAEDAKTLFCHFANKVSDDLVNKIVKFCGGIHYKKFEYLPTHNLPTHVNV